MRALQFLPFGTRGSTAALLLCCAMSASAIDLVTPDEARRSQQAPPVVEAQSSAPDPMAPLIAVVDPQGIDKALKNPFRMEIDFKTQAGARLDFSTFKAYYGAFKIDITQRLTAFVKVTKDGFSLDSANIPSGRHRLTLQVMDEKQRLAERELRLEVE